MPQRESMVKLGSAAVVIAQQAAKLWIKILAPAPCPS